MTVFAEVPSQNFFVHSKLSMCHKTYFETNLNSKAPHWFNQLPKHQLWHLPGRGESKRPINSALSEPYPLVTIRARKMNELKVPISADKGSH